MPAGGIFANAKRTLAILLVAYHLYTDWRVSTKFHISVRFSPASQEFVDATTPLRLGFHEHNLLTLGAPDGI